MRGLRIMSLIKIPTEEETFERIRKINILKCPVDVDENASHLGDVLNCIAQWKTKEEIKRCNELYYEIDHEMSSDVWDATETLRYEDKKATIKAFKTYYDTPGKSYTVDIKPMNNMPKNTGQAHMFSNGVIIKYPSMDNGCNVDGVSDHLRQHIIITHEAGHVLFHIPSWLDSPEVKPPITPEQEVSASRCGEWILSVMAVKCDQLKGKDKGMVIPSFLNMPSQALYDAIDIVMRKEGSHVREYRPEKYVKGAVGPVDRSRIINELSSA